VFHQHTDEALDRELVDRSGWVLCDCTPNSARRGPVPTLDIAGCERLVGCCECRQRVRVQAGLHGLEVITVWPVTPVSTNRPTGVEFLDGEQFGIRRRYALNLPPTHRWPLERGKRCFVVVRPGGKCRQSRLRGDIRDRVDPPHRLAGGTERVTRRPGSEALVVDRCTLDEPTRGSQQCRGGVLVGPLDAGGLYPDRLGIALSQCVDDCLSTVRLCHQTSVPRTVTRIDCQCRSIERRVTSTAPRIRRATKQPVPNVQHGPWWSSDCI